MTIEQFEEKQAKMSNEELIELAQSEITKLCITGGQSLKMCVPPMVTDTDMILCEIVKRFKRLI